MTAALATDLASSALGAAGCLAVVWWILRTPGRSFLEQRSVWLLGVLGMVYLVRSVGWLYGVDSAARRLSFWPVTLEPIVMALFVEGLLRRHLPLWVKGVSVGFTLFLVSVQWLPSEPRVAILTVAWPVGMVVIMTVFAWQMWRRRDAGLSREERHMLAGVTVVAVVAIPLVFSDGRALQPYLPTRMGAIGGLLLCRVLLTPPATDGLRDTVTGILRLIWRAAIVALVMTLPLGGITLERFLEALTLALALLLFFEIIDRLRRRERNEVEVALLHWLATAPREDFADWRRALRHAPLLGDAVILEADALARYDAPALRACFDKHGTLLSAPDLRPATVDTGGGRDANEQMLDVMSTHALTHVGLLRRDPLCLIGANVPQVAAPDTTLRLRAILRTGQDLLLRETAHA